MHIAVPHTWPEEDYRVALTPETTQRFVQMGCTVHIQAGLGRHACFDDGAYSAAGAKIGATAKEVLKGADLVLLVGPVPYALPKEAHVVGMLGGLQAQTNKYLHQQAFSLELLPRISVAQTMDVLSSQNNLRGYAAVIEAAYMCPRIFPMMTTAAGSLSPARVLVLGVGVAGLQAIATAKRLGAIVSAMDVRTETKTQVESLGATFLSVNSDEKGDTASGYGKEMSSAYHQQQREVLLKALATSDIVICSALIPGKAPPLLLDADAIASMRSGSLIIDLAADQPVLSEKDLSKSPHGNCIFSKRGEHIVKEGVSIIGPFCGLNRVSRDASALYARNLYNFVQLLWENGTFRKEHPLLQATCLATNQVQEESRC